MKFWKQSFTAKIINYFLLLALINVAVVGGFTYLKARKALQDSAFKRISVAATLKEGEIIRWFEDQQSDFLLTTQLPGLQSDLINFLSTTIGHPHYQSYYQELSQYLARIVKIKSNFQEISILDLSNKIVVSTNKDREQEYEILANISYVDEIESENNFAPIFYVSPVTGKLAITLAKSIDNQQHKRQGMILITLNLERIDRIVREQTGLDRSSETYLVGSLVSKNAFISRDTKSDREFPNGISSLGIDRSMSGISGYGLYPNYEGKSVLGVYRWLNDQDLALLVELSQDEAFAPANHLAVTTIMVGLVSIVGLLVGVNWLARQLHFSQQQLENYSYRLQLKAEEANAASRAKSLFLAHMSHELRTPLNAILGFSQLMERDANATVDQKELLAIINRSGEHLLNLINDILEMSKIEAGKMELNVEAIDLHLLLQTLQEMFQMRAEAKYLSLNFILAPDLPQYIFTDCRKLRQVLINLLSNAVKFTQTGGISLRVSSKNTTILEPNQILFFEIEDTGKGIAPEEIEKLFQTFVQTSSGVQLEGGTGLGLAISRQFISLMGGNIGVNSILGKGSTFYFDIQVSLAKSSQVESSLVQQQVKHIAPGEPNYRILIVDDREANCKLLVKLLQPVGFETRTASNGQEAIELWQAWQPDLIWMDIRMPVMDGYEATRLIKQQPQSHKTTIIALTASAFEEQRQKILAVGCDDFVRKPFPERVIFEKMAQYLGVKYVYEEKSSLLSSATKTKIEDKLTPEDLQCMPDQWRSQLHQAAIEVDGDLIEQLIDRIPSEHESIAQALAKMIRNYDFDSIVELTEVIE